MSNPFEIFDVNTCVIMSVDTTKIIKYSRTNIPKLEESMKTQNDMPAVTANDLNLGDEVCILYRINKSN